MGRMYIQLPFLFVCLMLTQTDGRYVNNYDQQFNFRCPTNQYLHAIYSHHHNGYEDRRFNLFCNSFPKDIPNSPTCVQTGLLNLFDLAFDYSCPTNHYIAGLASTHSNVHEDRIFSLHCCTKKVPHGKVLHGLKSEHNSRNEEFIYCDYA